MDVWLEKGREEKERDKEEREYGRKRGEREEKEREDGGQKRERDKRKEEIKDEGGRRERRVMVSHNYRNSQHLHIYSWLFL